MHFLRNFFALPLFRVPFRPKARCRRKGIVGPVVREYAGTRAGICPLAGSHMAARERTYGRILTCNSCEMYNGKKARFNQNNRIFP